MDADERRALAALSGRMKRACVAVLVEGFTHAEAGGTEGVSKWASMKRVQRARRKLRALGVETPRFRQDRFRTPAYQLGPIENV